MLFTMFCGALIGLVIGLALILAGYRLFLMLLPFWGFVFGFIFGAQIVTALFGEAFLATVLSWVVGLVVAVLFAVLSYLFYFIAVALFSFSGGYALGVGFMALIGSSFGLINFIVGLVVGVVVAFVVLRFNLQKWAIIIITSLAGAAVLVAIPLFALGVVPTVGIDEVGAAIRGSFLWMLLFVVAAVAGVVTQFRSTQDFVFEEPQGPAF